MQLVLTIVIHTGNFTGVPEAAGQKVNEWAWHTHTLRPHACMHTCYVRAHTIGVCMRTHLCYVSAQVTAQGHTTTLKPGQCSPQMMRGEVSTAAE